MGYKWDTRIGYHLVDPNRKLTLSSLINLFQDCGGFHGADCGFSNKQLADMGLAWIISTWQIAVNEMPDLDDKVLVETCPYSVKFFMAHRYYRLVSPDGFEYARANSLWLLMDMKTFKPVKITPEIRDAYGPYEDIFKGYDFGGRKVEPAGSGETLPAFEVAPFMIDPNSHVNNEQYIVLASSCLNPEMEWNFFRCQYTQQAKLGDQMTPILSGIENGVQIALNNDSGAPYFIGEWTNRKCVL